MPARFTARAVVGLHVRVFLGRRQVRCFAAVETDGDYFELLTDIERDLAKRSQHSIQNLITKHRTGVVNQRQHDRLAFEELIEADLAALLVFENRVERNLFVQSLIDADLLERRRQARRDLTRIRSTTIKRRVGLRHAGLSDGKEAVGSRQQAESENEASGASEERQIQSAQRTSENSPALQCWVKDGNMKLKARETGDRECTDRRGLCRPLRGLRFNLVLVFPAINRWAISDRPLRGLNLLLTNPHDVWVPYSRLCFLPAAFCILPSLFLPTASC